MKLLENIAQLATCRAEGGQGAIHPIADAALVPLVSGSGSLGVPVPTTPGQYYILAQQAGAWVAMTVVFYTN